MTKALNELTLEEAAAGLRAGDFTVRALWDACSEVAQARNPEFNAYLELFEADEAAIAKAEERIREEGEKAPLLCGIPLAIKDNILIEGHVASAASKMLETYRATYDATVIRKLREAGALFLGRTNMDEFALGGSTENSAFGPTKNPHDPTRVAGGTSGGSAAAVAAHMAIAALGTDTGGSVRNPASYCGVVGMKPTYGGASRSGLIAAASSFDQAGPITKTARDAEILYEAIAGQDPLDSTTTPDGLYPAPKGDVKTIGVIKSSEPVADSVRDTMSRFEETIASLKKAGYEIKEVEIPSLTPSLAAYYIINFAEVSANLARFDGIRYGSAERGATPLEDYVLSRTEGFGPETIRRILLGTFVLSSGYIDAYYRKAVAAREVLTKEFEAAFEKVDVIATPTMPTPAFRIGEKADPLSLYLEDVYTVTANLTGMPALSVPMGTVTADSMALPVGIQFVAPKGAEALLFKIGTAVAKETV